MAKTANGNTIPGTLKFVPGQSLSLGENVYVCIFTPSDSNFASITLELEINIK